MERSAPLEWFRALGLYTRTDEAGRVYPYSNQAADVLALLEGQMARLGVEVRTGCTVNTISQNRNGYTVLFDSAERSSEGRREPAREREGLRAGPRRGRSTIAADGFDFSKPYEPVNPPVVAAEPTQPTAAAAGKPDPLRRHQRPIAVLLGGLGRK